MSRRDLSQRYWDAYAATLEPPPGAAARTLAAVQRRARAGEHVDDAPAPVEQSPRRAAAGLVLLGKSAAISVGIATATLLTIKLAVVGWSQLAGGPPASVETTVERSTGSTAREGSAAPAPPPAPSSSISPPPPLPVTPTATPAPASTEPSRRGRADAPIADHLRAEVSLMDRARAALEQDDADALWRLTAEHARRFPDGALVEEREAWQAIAACRLARAGAAARAEAFLAAHPRSAQADKLRRACAAVLHKP